MFSSSDTRTAKLLPFLFWFAVGISALTAAYAAASARGLVYDGSYYLLAIAGSGHFQFFEPARLSVQVLQQLPAVFAARLGVQNLWTLGQLFSFGMAAWPVAITAACWFVLPRGEKSWISGPLVNLVFAIPAASFIGVSEGIIASCLVWLAALLVMFRLAERVGALAALAATLACAVAHESTVLCLLVLAWLAAVQISAVKQFSRFVALLVVVVSLAGAAYMARWIVMPRSTVERGDFLLSVVGGFVGSPTAPNIAAIASLVAALCMVLALVAARWSKAAAIVGVVAVLACGVGFVLAPATLASPSRFFAARGLPLIVTTVLVGAFAILRWRRLTPARAMTGSVFAIVLALVLAQALMQVTATAVWGAYVSDLRALVASRTGVVSHQAAMAALDPDNSRFRRELLESWSVEPLSILLAPRGQIVAVVAAASSARWVPYRWSEPASLPHMPQLNWSHFVAPPAR